MAGMNRNDWRRTVSGRRAGDGLHQDEAADPCLNPQGSPGTDQRLARIMLLQKAIADGVYNVPAISVAERMVEGMLRKGKTP